VNGTLVGYRWHMFGPRSMSHALLAAPFVVGGINALRSPAAMAPAAAQVGVPLAEHVGLHADPVTLVRINAGVQVSAGSMLAFGVFPRVAALALAASVVPTTVAGHRFWERGANRRQQLTQFAKNAGVLGGLLAAALDTGGRPSYFWSGRRAATRASDKIGDVLTTAYHVVPGAD
jgi:putative oxidoreductase